jgi:hypothetical protein
VRLDPFSGRAITATPLGFYPVSLALSADGGRLYALGGTPSNQLVLAAFAARTGRRVAYRPLTGLSDGPLAVVPGGVWVPVSHVKTQSTTVRLFQGPGLKPGPALYGLAFDTEPYVTGRTLWLVDSGGEGATICADPGSGAVRATGASVTIGSGSMAGDANATYLESNLGLDDQLLQVKASPACNGAARAGAAPGKAAGSLHRD